jgi:hypothetical protein
LTQDFCLLSHCLPEKSGTKKFPVGEDKKARQSDPARLLPVFFTTTR